MNKSELTPLWKVANNILSSISSTVRASLLKRVIKDRKLSFFPCSIVNKLDEECLCLCPPIKLLQIAYSVLQKNPLCWEVS